MLTTILATAVVLGVLILVHELGHFWAAKAVDIEVSRFSIGFGPRIAGFRRGETEYVLSAFPLGGYVKMAGMVDEEVTSRLEGADEESSREPSPRDFDRKPLWARFLVISAGVLMNLLFAVAAFSVVAGVEGVVVPVAADVAPGSPAERAGLREGDRFLAVAGRPTRDVSEVIRGILQRPGEPVRVRVERDGERLDITVVPETIREYDDIARDTVSLGRIGVGFETTEATKQRLGPAAAFAAGVSRTWTWVREVGDFLVRLVTGQRSPKELGGPIVIGQLSGQFARAGLLPLLNFMAIISVNLAVLNLLPIPVLDGGHLAFLTVEALRGGRAVGPEQRIRLTQIGMLLVIGLMVFAFANDILRLVGA
ncbi:MAG: RIP metalloprotease RseP [Gemmatimonadota bacterium]|nr:RIP metalloprotease RseP [Gemmatimonadota bacterium]